MKKIPQIFREYFPHTKPRLAVVGPVAVFLFYICGKFSKFHYRKWIFFIFFFIVNSATLDMVPNAILAGRKERVRNKI